MVAMEFVQRKSPRIPKFDYTSAYYYFITICTSDKKCIFGDPMRLNMLGETARECIQEISEHYTSVEVTKSVVMPNHIHMILFVKEKTDIPITRIIGQYKMEVTKRIHRWKPNITVWQRSFHDHIIRTEKGYLKIWEYIENNPAKWEEDCFYPTEN